METRYALINLSTDKVESIWFVSDLNKAETLKPEGFALVQCGPEVKRGATYDGYEFTNPVVVPLKVTRYQALVTLHLNGLLTAAEAVVYDPQADPLAKIAWETATEFYRDSPLIAALAPALSLTSTDIDNLFIAAHEVV